MAKKVGSEDKADRAGAKGAGAPEPTNQVVTAESYLAAVKEITMATAKVKAANEVRKSIRKQWKAAGIELGVLDSMVRMADWNRGEIRDHFEIQQRYAEWLGLPVAPGVLKQGDILKGLSDDEVQRREWFALGRTYNRTGKSGRPPEECPDEFHQAFMAGFNEEDESAWADSESPEQQEPTPPPAAASGEAQDFAQPSWNGFSEDPSDWFVAQWKDFSAWFESIPTDATVRIVHPGVLIAFRRLRDGEVNERGEETPKGKEAAAAAPKPAPAAAPAPTRLEECRRLGAQACKDDQPRDTPPAELTNDETVAWLAGWDEQSALELERREQAQPQPGTTAKPPKKGPKSKPAVH